MKDLSRCQIFEIGILLDKSVNKCYKTDTVSLRPLFGPLKQASDRPGTLQGADRTPDPEATTYPAECMCLYLLLRP